MLVLLTIIVLGMLSISVIALRTEQGRDASQHARANARMALMLAIGELQREMGPDSRISAAHDVGSPSGGQPHWTAVYDAWKHDVADSDMAVSPASRIPEFRKWLVSGANGVTENMALMVGPGSLGDDSAPEDQVEVPMENVKGDSKSGRIAWWVSDESQKAKVNAGPESSEGQTFGLADAMFDSQSPPHVGHRAFPKLAALEWKDGQRGIMVSTSEINLAAGLGRTGLGSAIHDLTVHAAGVLADVSTGRLKRDLSNLLSRDVEELEDMPLYLADGRMNRFAITEDGELKNAPGLPQSGGGANKWGINLEELSLFHNIHREVDWSEGAPMLVTKADPDSASQDRFYMYGKPAVEAMQFILSLKAVPQGRGDSSQGLYKLEMMLDGMVALSNPNDVRLRFPPGLVKNLFLLNFPYEMKLKIEKEDGTILSPPATRASARSVFDGYIEGGFGGIPSDGFDLEPGEAAAFGSTDANGFKLNIRRGFVPSGGVRMTAWNLNAIGLKENDMVDFELSKLISALNGSNSNVYFQAWHDKGSASGRIFESAVLSQGPNPDGDLLNRLLPPKILPPQVLRVKDFIDKPQPVLLFSIMKNVEKSSAGDNPDAFASRAALLDEAARVGRAIHRYGDVIYELHETQLIFSAAPMNYEFGNDKTLPGGAGGRLVYHGGGRQPGSGGGSANVVKRRIPLSPPLSLGAFENAIACGYRTHFGSGGGAAGRIGPGSDPSTAALYGGDGGSPIVTKAIGNSWANPFVESTHTFEGDHTDPSWMANTALWDTWFLSGIVDTSGLPSSSWMEDRRTSREQFMDFAEEGKPLRNKRYLFHPYASPQQAASELFEGSTFKDSAINKLPRYLLVDGAFNVNSTSAPAWEAFLSSVRDQEVVTAGGEKRKFEHPFNTLGYAVNTATSSSAADRTADWVGLRDLTEDEIEELAEAIVTEVKERGPFLNLADFVNRRPGADSSPEHRALGALQAAIDLSGLNKRFVDSGRDLDPGDLVSLDGGDTVDDEPVPARAIGSAGYLSQAALLTAVGSQITVRGDTFIIRAYGDHRNAADEVEAKAWCEAVVQRVPEYVDPTDEPEADDGGPGSDDKLAAANALFGRKFEILSFRWLNPNEV